MSTTSISQSAEMTSGVDLTPNKQGWADEIHKPDQVYNANVPVDLIERDPGNRVPAEGDIKARAESIEQVGLLQPIVVRSLPDGRYRIVAGETRWRAFIRLGLETIPALIRREETDLGAAQRRLVENMQRAELTPVERARQFKELVEAHGMKQKEIGRLAGGLSQPVVANAIRMLALPEDVLAQIDGGKLSEAHGVALVRWAKWPNVVRHMVKRMGNFGYTAKRLVEEVLPLAESLREAGLVERIRVKAQSWCYGAPEVVYKVSKGLMEAGEFFAMGDYVYYILPENEAENVWTPERVRQDEARERREAAAAKREAEDRKAGVLTGDQVAAREARERAKARRAEIGAAMVVAMDKLRRVSSVPALLVAILVEAGVAGGYSAKRILDAAESVGVALPKGLVDVEEGGQGMRDVPLMAGMEAVDLLRVAVAVLLQKQADDACKYGGSRGWKGGDGVVPANVEAVMNLALPKLAGGAVDVGILGDLVSDDNGDAGEVREGIEDGGGGGEKRKRSRISQEIKERVRERVYEGRTMAEIASEFGISLPAVQNIKKEFGLVKSKGGVA